MRKGVLFSGLLHLAVVVIAVFGLPSLFEPAEVQRPIPVRIVDIGEVTTPPKQEKKPQPATEKTPPATRPEPAKPEPQERQAQMSPPPAPPAPPTPPEPAPKPEPVAVPAPSEPIPEPKPAPEPKPEPARTKPLPVPTTKPNPPEKKVAEKKPEARKPAADAPAKDEPEVTDFASVLKNVEKLKQRPAPAESDPEPTAEPVAQERNLSDEPLTLSEIDAIRAQIEQCWNVPVGARNAEDLIVEIRVTLNPDGSVFAMPEILNTTRMASDPFFRAAAESAQRAVLKCSPLRMPSKKYSVWKEVTLRFDPSQMLQ